MTADADRPSTPETPLYASLGASQPHTGTQDPHAPHDGSGGRTADPAPARLRLGDLCGAVDDTDLPMCWSCCLAVERGGDPEPSHPRCVATHAEETPGPLA